MKRVGFLAFAFIVFGNVTDVNANEIVEKCEAVMAELDVSNVAEGCACFATEIGEERTDEYLNLDTAEWDAKASQPLKDASDVCFPGLQDS